ncbi:HDOD domain-containing protein [Massilia sp. CT11-108]|uniref:HDOD domain-containing protein n=1 Tax=Massilia sp. CT11-108 TaxID=3393900 RepID=UPI0039A55F20
MPQILIKLLAHLQADDLGMPELAALVAKDAGMTGKILTVANSSAYHRNSRQPNLEQAMVALGTDMIKTLVISDSVFQTFNSFPNSSATDLRAFWKNSLTAAVLARETARRMNYAQPEEAYLAGLLHNVGRLALLATAPKEYAFNFTARDDEDLCAVEQRTLQITHAEAGAWLIERWQLDSFLADSVLYHHEPSERLEAAHPLIRIVRVAHVLACHAHDDTLVDEARALCGLGPEAPDELLGLAARQVEKAAIHLGIDLAGADDLPVPAAFAPPPPVDPVQQRLSEEVRNLVLVSEVGQAFARQQGESGLLEAMTRSARILFDFANAVVLLENPTGQALVGAPTANQQRIAEFTVPLAIIKNYLSVLDSKLERQEPVSAELSILNEEIDRVGQLVGSLTEIQLGAATSKVDSAPAADVARVVDDVLRLFRTTNFIPANVEIVVSMSDVESRIEGDPDILKQILVNLVKNAIEALSGSGGRIEIANRGHVNRERRLYLELVVSDTGPGLSREVLANLFSAVKSTKEGPHHGLGLSIVHSLVKKLNGHIACRSGTTGTSFEILLPAHAGAGAPAIPPVRALGSV